MRSKNKILSIFTILMLIISSYMTVNAFPADVDNVPYEEQKSNIDVENLDSSFVRAYELLSYIKAINEEKSQLDVTEEITKAYAADVFSRLDGGDVPAAKETFYTDVPLNHKYLNGISKAAQLGMLPATDGKFYPNKKASLEDICYMAIRFLNRDYMMGKKSDLMYSNELSLLRGIDPTIKTVTKKDFFVILENILNSQYVLIYGVDADTNNPNFSVSQNSYLNEIHKIYKTPGILTGYGVSSNYSNVDLDEGKVEIDKTEYYTNILIPYDYVGMSVGTYVYRDEASNRNNVIAVWVDENRNRIFEINGKIGTPTSVSIPYSENDRTKEKNVSPTVNVIYNDVFYGNWQKAVNNSMANNADRIVLIDNNCDSTYDVIKIEKYTYYVVSAVSTYSNQITYKNGKNVQLKENNSYYSFTLNDEQLNLSDIKTDDVLSVREGNTLSGKTVYNAYVSRMKVSGTLEMISSDTVGDYYLIDGEKYYLTSEYKNYLSTNQTDEKPEVGKVAAFSVSHNNKIVYSSASSGYSYMFVMASADSSSALSKQYYVKGYKTDGGIIELEFTKNVYLYDENNINGKKVTAKEVYNKLNNYNDAVGYMLNSDGKITHFAFPLDRTAYQNGSIYYPLTLDYNYYSVAAGEAGRAYRGILGKKYTLDSAPIIVYPSDSALYDNEKAYSVRRINYWATEHYFNDERIKVFNADKFGVAQFCTMNGTSATTLTKEDNLYVISEIYKGVDEEGDPATIIKYQLGKTVAEKQISTDCVLVDDGTYTSALSSVNNLKAGDVIQFTTDNLGNISIIRPVFRLSQLPNEYYCGSLANKTHNATDVFSSFGVIYAKVIDRENKKLLVNASSTGDDATLDGPLTLGHSVYTAVTYTIYDTLSGKTVAGTINDIQIGDSVLMRKYYNHVLDVVIIK